MNMSECQSSAGFCDVSMWKILGYILQSQSPQVMEADSRDYTVSGLFSYVLNTIFLIILNIYITIKYSDVLKAIYYFLLHAECYNK